MRLGVRLLSAPVKLGFPCEPKIARTISCWRLAVALPHSAISPSVRPQPVQMGAEASSLQISLHGDDGRLVMVLQLRPDALCKRPPTLRAASAFITAMPRPTIISGHAECHSSAVTKPAPIMARLAKASLRAERNAARVRLPPECRCFASKNAQNRFTASAPIPVRVSATGTGGKGRLNLDHAIHSVAIPGASRMAARHMPNRVRLTAVQPSAAKIRRFTSASSRKSTLSANSETEPILEATANSTPKYPRLSRATQRTVLRKLAVGTVFILKLAVLGKGIVTSDSGPRFNAPNEQHHKVPPGRTGRGLSAVVSCRCCGCVSRSG